MSDRGWSPFPFLVLLGALTFAMGNERCPPVVRQGVLRTASVATGDPELAVGGSAVFVAWREAPKLFVSKANSVTNPNFNPRVEVDGDAEDGLSIQATSSRVYLAWKSALSRDVRFSFSADAGVSFAAAKVLDSVPDGVMHPQVVISGTNIAVSWLEYLSATTAAFKIRTSQDFGASFMPEQSLSSGANDSKPAMASAGSTLHVVWCDGTTLRLKRSTDNGLTFGPATALTGAQSGCTQPQIRAVNTDVHVVWSDSASSASSTSEVFAVSSLDGGATFGKPTNLSQTTNARSDSPSLSAVGQKVYVAWRDRGGDTAGDDDILLAKSDDRGGSYSKWQLLSPTDFEKASNGPVVRAAGANVHVAWQDLAMDNYDVFYKRSADEGQTFGIRQILSTNKSDPRGEGYPRMHAYGATRPNRFIVWSLSDPGKKEYQILYDSWFRKEP